MPELGNLIFGHSFGDFAIARNCGFEEILSALILASADSKSDLAYGVHFENDVFELHPYCWCAEEECPQCGAGEQANFKYKPSGLEIRWYKYPLRDAYSNQELTLEKFDDIITDCLNSLEVK